MSGRGLCLASLAIEGPEMHRWLQTHDPVRPTANAFSPGPNLLTLPASGDFFLPCFPSIVTVSKPPASSCVDAFLCPPQRRVVLACPLSLPSCGSAALRTHPPPQLPFRTRPPALPFPTHHSTSYTTTHLPLHLSFLTYTISCPRSTIIVPTSSFNS